MISFKEYITESNEPIEILVKEVDSYLSKGQIVKPQYETLKRDIDKHIRKVGEEISKTHVWGTGGKLYDEGVGDLGYAVPQSLTEVGSLGNKLKKENVPNHPLHKALTHLYKTYFPLFNKMKELKTKMVTTTAVRAEKKKTEAVVKQKKMTDSSSLVKVLTDHLNEFINRAYELSGEQVDWWWKQLEQHDWDIDKAAPKPSVKMGKTEYRLAKDKRDRYLSVVTKDPKSSICKPNKAKKEAYQEQAKQNAHDEYMAWVHKMIEKIGKPVAEAWMTGNPWKSSLIHVKTTDGEEQTWKTQMIINQSKYSKLFNQFPTRRA